MIPQRPARWGPHDPQQSSTHQRPRSLLVWFDHRFAIARLVARGPQRVRSEGVQHRHRRLLLQQAAEDALILGIEDRELAHAHHIRSPNPTLVTVPVPTEPCRRHDRVIPPPVDRQRLYRRPSARLEKTSPAATQYPLCERPDPRSRLGQWHRVSVHRSCRQR